MLEWRFSPSPFGSAEEGHLGDVDKTCDVESVQAANMAQLHPILHDLVNTTFFRLFRVAKTPKCFFWRQHEEEEEAKPSETCAGGQNDGFAGFGAKKSVSSMFSSAPMSFEKPPDEHVPCGIDTEEVSSPPIETSAADIGLDRTKTFAEQVASQIRDTEGAESCEFEEDLPTYWLDMCSADHTKGSDVEDINLIKNPERNTGYNGSHIWDSMYKENCFEVGSNLPRGRFGNEDAMCYEERVLYRLLSGWHASTTISICKSYFAPGTRKKGVWVSNPQRYVESLGKHPERVKNLHFSFVVMLRAIKKASVFLRSYPFPAGEGQETGKTQSLMTRLLDSQVLSLCSPLFEAFDETRLFDTKGEEKSTEQRSRLKRQFKSAFRNITELVDCVQCQRCRLHAKLFSTGLGAALKTLLTPLELLSSTLSRDEVVSMVNVLWKLSEAMEDAKELTKQYWLERTESEANKSPAAAPSRESEKLKVAPDVVDSIPSKPISGQANSASTEAMVALPSRQSLLDVAIGAVKRAADGGAISKDTEQEVLRSLIVQKASDEILLLAKHYATEQPFLFTKLASEVAGAQPSTASTMPSTQAILGSSLAPADAVIIGGGLAGMTAAMTLLDRGATVIIVDKQPYLGGNSGKASSGINSALNTSVDSLIADTTKSAGVLARPALINKLANDSADAVQWLMDRTGIDLSQRAQLGGHTAKRTLRPSNAFVGAELTFVIGELLKKISSFPNKFRLLTKTTWNGLDQPSGNDQNWRVSAVGSDGSVEVLQAASVVIASGGFGHDRNESESYLLKYRPDLKDFPTTLGAQTTGDGLKIAKKLGAQLIDMDRIQLHPTGFVDPAKPEEHTKTLGAELLRGVGGLLLDQRGQRFTDELGTRQAVVNAQLRSSNTSDSGAADARHFALVLNGKAAAMAERHVTLYTKKGLLKKVSGLDGLAEHLSLKSEKLRETFEAYNAAAVVGHDEFGRKVFPTHWPIESNEEFYVGKVTPVIHYTMGGIAIDIDGRVISEASKQAMPGLYAIGEASGGVHGDNRLAGNSLLECTVFGHHVGRILPLKQEDKMQVREDIVKAPEADAAPATPAESKLRRISAEELAAAPKNEQYWVALYGKVYDLTDYLEDHPGGVDAIKDVAGVDGTETFETVHNKELLDRMGFEPIGEFASEATS